MTASVPLREGAIVALASMRVPCFTGIFGYVVQVTRRVAIAPARAVSKVSIEERGHKLNKRLSILAVLVVIGASEPLITSFDFEPSPPMPRVASYPETGELVVITRNSPTTRFEKMEGDFAGLEHDLVELFAKQLGINVRYIEAQSYPEVLPRLARHQAHFAAAGLSVTQERTQRFKFAPAYMNVQQIVVYNGGTRKPKSARDLLSKQIQVVADSSGAERIRRLGVRMPSLTWQEVPTVNPEDLLMRVSEGAVDYAVTSSAIFDVARNYYPTLSRGMSLGNEEQVAWAFPQDADPALMRAAEQFFARIKRDGTLERLMHRYFGNVKRLDRADLTSFYEAMRSRLPSYRKVFKDAQEVSGVDWRLIAALAFQESRWDPLATSPTGVRGMMMLTEETAVHLKVSDRLNARQSIIAGSKYFRDLRDKIPERIQEPDRTWFALAAYNQGFGHIEDARVLAQRRGLNPDLWIHVKQMLPLLSDAQHYTTLKRGFARGGEAVYHAENVRTYYEILLQHEEPYEPNDPLREKLITASSDRQSGADAMHAYLTFASSHTRFA